MFTGIYLWSWLVLFFCFLGVFCLFVCLFFLINGSILLRVICPDLLRLALSNFIFNHSSLLYRGLTPWIPDLCDHLTDTLFFFVFLYSYFSLSPALFIHTLCNIIWFLERAQDFPFSPWRSSSHLILFSSTYLKRGWSTPPIKATPFGQIFPSLPNHSLHWPHSLGTVCRMGLPAWCDTTVIFQQQQ